jgi:hypothetical protein
LTSEHQPSESPLRLFVCLGRGLEATYRVKFPLLSRPQQRKTMTPAALAANKANAQKAGRPKGKISLSDISFRDRCRVRDEEHIAILEHIARYSENEGFRLAAIRDLFDRGRGRPRQAIEGSGPGGAIPFSVILPAALCDDDD